MINGISGYSGANDFSYLFEAYGGKLIVNGGTYTQSHNHKKMFSSVDSPIEINGGTFTSEYEFFNLNTTRPRIYIYGGTFNYTSDYYDGKFNFKYNTQEFKIYNARINSTYKDFSLHNNYSPNQAIRNRFTDLTKVTVDGADKTSELGKTRLLTGRRFVISTPVATHASLSVTEPVHGAKPRAATVNSSLGICREDALTSWYDITAGRELASGDTFTKGHKYRLQAVIQADEGYLIGAVPVIGINGDSSIRPTVTKLSDYLCKVTAEFDCRGITVSEVNVTLTEPVAGEVMNDTMTTSAPGVIICRGELSSSTQNRGFWYHGDRKVSAGDRFTAGETYTALFNLCPEDNYEFAADLTVKVNGRDASFVRKSGGYSTYEIDFTAYAGKITEIQMQAVMPKAGNTPQPLTVTKGDVRVATIWYHGTEKMATGEKFIAGERYTMYCMVSRLSASQTFSQNVLVYVNGGRMQVNSIYEGYILCQRTVTAAESAVLKGDVDGNGKVNMRDYAVLQKYLLDPSSVTIVTANADMDGDGKVNMRDYALLQKLLLTQTG